LGKVMGEGKVEAGGRRGLEGGEGKGRGAWVEQSLEMNMT
jgi:hypothetical protein